MRMMHSSRDGQLMPDTKLPDAVAALLLPPTMMTMMMMMMMMVINIAYHKWRSHRKVVNVTFDV